MPNATARANARTLPEDRPPRTELEKRRAFEKAYSRWLKARAGREDPDGSEKAMSKLDFEEAQTERELILTPSMFDWMVWRKVEVFEVVLSDELRNGPRSDGFLMLAFGAIKADLLGLGIGNGGRLQ